MAWYGSDFEFTDYVSVAERKDRARTAAAKVARKRGRALAPVGPLEGHRLVRTFWGKAWCDNLESYSDYANRLPRGRSYARHGAVIDLEIAKGKVSALVSGTSTYETSVTIRALDDRRWKEIAAACAGQIDSLLDLLHGKLSRPVMEIVTRRERGLFPAPDQISFACSCPDRAGLCKHVAAALYGVGVRFDDQPELLFALRGVDHADLISGAAEIEPARARRGPGRRKVIDSPDLTALFGIEVEEVPEVPEVAVDGTATSTAAAPAKRVARKAKAKAPAQRATVTARRTAGKPSIETASVQRPTRRPR